MSNPLPKDDDDYPLWLLIATKKALFRCMEDPELEDARAVLQKIDAAIANSSKEPKT